MTESYAAQLQRRNYELSVLNEIAQALNGSVDLDQALHTALAQVVKLLDLHTGWVWLLDEDTGHSYLAAAQNLPPVLAQNPRKMEGNCYCLRTYRAGDLDGAANVNVVTCSRLEGLVDGTDGLQYHSSIPLYAHGRKLGVMNVASTDWRELSPEDLQLLYTVGDMISIAIERARLFDKSARWGAVEERNRLAREIHDTLAQGLTAVSLQLESADALLESEAEAHRIRKAIHHALILTRANLEEARRSVLDLRAAPLEGRTLTEALQLLVDQTDIPVEMVVTGANRPLSPRVEIGLYRIAQEALTNIGRHARASKAWLEVTMSPEKVKLMVSDNGCGFDPEQIPQNRYGLLGLNERVKLLHGRLQVESGPGQGTRLEVMIPLRARKK
ncbi:MAG: GAF domain-containing sensor histidine kinase [Ardenticatenaceae bacterium]|nr:GAF domain-containing sensor histidine kinase [Ardenticatenaceae bacterium]